MTNLKENIDYYMNLKGIKMYSHLLVDIAHELGIRGQEAYAFADRERANFSKMLKGERPLKYEFIIPLEKIFGVSLARMMNKDAYKLPLEKDNIPFNKGFRYYAYLDDPKLYREEFNLLQTKDGKSILNETDEFGKTFLDYVVEYHSVNAVRYLHDEFGMKLQWYHNQFNFNKEKGIIWVHFENSIEFARLVASLDDAELFNDIYDSFNMFYTNGHYGGDGALFYQPEYFEILMNNEKIFDSLFEIKKYEVELGNSYKRKHGVSSKTYYSVNPIINNCLRYALKNLNKYKAQAAEMLKFGIKHNERVMSEHNPSECYVCNELGAIKEFRNEETYEFVVIVDVNVTDKEINDLIEKLPKFNNYR